MNHVPQFALLDAGYLSVPPTLIKQKVTQDLAVPHKQTSMRYYCQSCMQSKEAGRMTHLCKGMQDMQGQMARPALQVMQLLGR